jgi:hypothetical protein
MSALGDIGNSPHSLSRRVTVSALLKVRAEASCRGLE